MELRILIISIFYTLLLISASIAIPTSIPEPIVEEQPAAVAAAAVEVPATNDSVEIPRVASVEVTPPELLLKNETQPQTPAQDRVTPTLVIGAKLLAKKLWLLKSTTIPIPIIKGPWIIPIPIPKPFAQPVPVPVKQEYQQQPPPPPPVYYQQPSYGYSQPQQYNSQPQQSYGQNNYS